MPNYENGKIYKLVNDVNESIYVGSTCQTLKGRMNGHRTDANERRKGSRSLVYNEMRKIGVHNFKIALIESFPCDSKAELEAREFHVMKRYIRRGTELLNSITEIGKHSEQSKIKMRALLKGKVGFASRAFKRGSLKRIVYKDKSPAWVFRWKEEGRSFSRAFATIKYGEKGARRLAEKVRNQLYPL